MDRFFARGLKIVTEEKSRSAHVSRSAEPLRCASGGESELPPVCPPSPLTQALLDSDILDSVLNSSLERCLPLEWSPLALQHEGFFRVDLTEDDDEPSHTHLYFTRTMEEDDSPSCDASEAWPSRPEFSPTSTVYSEWDQPSSPIKRTTSPSRKRSREQMEIEAGSWDAECECAPRR